MHRKGIVQKRPAERVQSRPHENARHKRRRACAPRLAQVPCHWSHGPGTRTNCNATRRHRSRANARRARGTCRRFVRTAHMGSGRRRPSGAGPCGQSASEPSRSSTASCRRRDLGLYPSSLPHCTYTTNSATPRRRKSAGGHRGPGCCQKSCRNFHIGRSEGIRWQSDGNQMAIRGPQRTIGGHQMAINCNQHVHYLSHRGPGCCQKGSAHLSHTYSPCSFFGGGPVCPARKREAQAEHRVRGPSGPETSPRARDQSHSERPSMILSGQPQAITPGFLPLVSWAWHSHQLQRHAPPSQSRECTPSARNVSKVRSHRSHG